MNVSLYTTHSIYNKKKHYIIYLKYLSVISNILYSDISKKGRSCEIIMCDTEKL